MTDPVDDLAELIHVELLHGTDPETPVDEKYRHVARCLLDDGWTRIEPGGTSLNSDEVEELIYTFTANMQAAAAAVQVLCERVRDNGEQL